MMAHAIHVISFAARVQSVIFAQRSSATLCPLVLLLEPESVWILAKSHSGDFTNFAE